MLWPLLSILTATPTRPRYATSASVDHIDLGHNEAFDKFQEVFMVEAPSAERFMIWDVGANDGGWTRNVLKLCRQVRARKRDVRLSTEVHVVEPQPRFQVELHALLDDWPHGIVHQAAAWTDASRNLTFFLSRMSMYCPECHQTLLHSLHHCRLPFCFVPCSLNRQRTRCADRLR